MKRSVGAELQITAGEESDVELQVAVARAPGLKVREKLSVVHEDHGPIRPTELAGPHHGRLHLLTVPPGATTVTYEATVKRTAQPPEVDPTAPVRCAAARSRCGSGRV